MDMELIQKIDAEIDQSREAVAQDTIKLIRINSEQGEPVPGAPLFQDRISPEQVPVSQPPEISEEPGRRPVLYRKQDPQEMPLAGVFR